MTTYRTIRFYAADVPSEAIDTGLTLEQAKAHCSDPNTNSGSATAGWATAITAAHGAWCDGYREEDG